MLTKQLKNENNRSRKGHHNMPSFSSSLLDEMYRSIDGNVEKTEEFKSYKEKPVKKQGGYKANGNKIAQENETTRFERACLQDNDVLFFSSTSTSSSDSSGQLSSDTEFFGSRKKTNVSGLPTRPKPVRTGATAQKHEQQEDSYLFDEYENRQKKCTEKEVNKAKSRALKIYANLKKMKQPISPGGRLTTFINSLFNNQNGKKAKGMDSVKGYRDMNSTKVTSTCSSATSFSRSCLNKCSPISREKAREVMQRTVRFNPVSMIADEESRPFGKKSMYDEDMERYGRPPLPPNAIAELRQSIKEKNRKIEEVAQKVLDGYNRQNVNDFSIFKKIHGDNDEEEDDAMSDSSSDLFEIDHLKMFGDNRFCEELPVYETTRFNTNRAIASGLSR